MCFDLKKWRFLEVMRNTVFMHKKWPKIFGNSGKNPSHPQKFACSYTYG